jgi:hypothetical protein
VLFAFAYLLLRPGGPAVRPLLLRSEQRPRGRSPAPPADVLRRQLGKAHLRRRGRLFMAAISRALPRARWSSFLVRPQTLVGHKNLGSGA